MENEIIKNLLKQSEILLKESVKLSEDIKDVIDMNKTLKMSNIERDRGKDEIMRKILKESEEIRKISAQVLSGSAQISEISESNNSSNSL